MNIDIPLCWAHTKEQSQCIVGGGGSRSADTGKCFFQNADLHSCLKVPVAPGPRERLAFSVFSMVAILTSVRCSCRDLHFPGDRWGCLLAIWTSCFLKCLLMSLEGEGRNLHFTFESHLGRPSRSAGVVVAGALEPLAKTSGILPRCQAIAPSSDCLHPHSLLEPSQVSAASHR